MNAAQMISRLEWCEVNSRLASDCRELLRAERFSLVAAIRSGDESRIAAAMRETRRVCAMWGVDLGR